MALLIDHLVFATPDLDRSVDELAERMGVRAVPGGRHVGRGTHNALLHLGGRTYLEIIGPDPHEGPATGRTLPFGIERLEAPRLVWYAVATDDLAGTVTRARAAGMDPGEPVEMQRARPDGVVLRWMLSTPAEVPDGGAVPFLIDWLDSPHPSQDAPGGCTLIELRITHPDPNRIRRHLEVLGGALPVVAGEPAHLVATIATPNGTVTLR